MKSQIKVLSVILVLAILVMVSGCADQGTTDTGTERRNNR
ncbi:MAG: hypothetical protein PWQ75_1962 [Methanolobus sp.]|jgi:glycine betaine/proline transport system substrate-binding protein|nr:hypothetical protein [Methanolobus sp.]MDK2832210.1 hypothetical protein [Methanolobus sp.]